MLVPKLVVPGGHDPAWGAASLAVPGPGADGGNNGNNGGNRRPEWWWAGPQGQSPPPPTDLTAPSLALGKASTAKLLSALKKGYSMKLNLSEAARVTGTLTLGGAGTRVATRQPRCRPPARAR